MKSLFLIIAIANLYMLTFIFGRADLGTGRPILVVGYFGMMILWGVEFAINLRESRKDLTTDEMQDEFRKSFGRRNRR